MSGTGEQMLERAAQERWSRGELSEAEWQEAQKHDLTREEMAAALLCDMTAEAYARMRVCGDIRAYRRHVKGEQGGAK